jgi:hypothetical protein
MATRQNNRASIRHHREKQRIRIKRAWDSGVIHAKIALRDRSEDNLLRAKLDRKGSLVFAVTLANGGTLRVEWSREGRTDQFDILEAGRVIFTGRPELAMREIVALSAAMNDRFLTV